jgi:hypothetical protein
MTEEAFAPKLRDYELLLLGKVIKYAGFDGERSKDYSFAVLAFVTPNPCPSVRPGWVIPVSATVNAFIDDLYPGYRPAFPASSLAGIFLAFPRRGDNAK